MRQGIILSALLLLATVSCYIASSVTPTPVLSHCLSIEPEWQFVRIDFEEGSEYSQYYQVVLYFDPPQIMVVPAESNSEEGGIFSLSYTETQRVKELVFDYLNNLTVAESNNQTVHTPLCILTAGEHQLQFITPSLVLTDNIFCVPREENKPSPCQILGEMANRIMTSTNSR